MKKKTNQCRRKCFISIVLFTHLSAGVGPDVGLRLLKAFNHFVFIDSELGTVPESFLSFLMGDPGSDGRPKNNSFCKKTKKIFIRTIGNTLGPQFLKFLIFLLIFSHIPHKI